MFSPVITHPKIAMCPDGSVQWDIVDTTGGKLFLAQDAPTEAIGLLHSAASGETRSIDNRIGSGKFGIVGGFAGFALKTMFDPPESPGDPPRIDDIRANVSLSKGLNGIHGVNHDGVRYRTPEYFGILRPLTGPEVWVMSYEDGSQEDLSTIATAAARHKAYSNALKSVGALPRLVDFDDSDNNSILMYGPDGLEVVKLDIMASTRFWSKSVAQAKRHRAASRVFDSLHRRLVPAF